MKVLAAQSCPTLCNPLDCSPPDSSVHGDSPGKNTGVGCHSLLQGISLTQGLNPGLLHCRRILYHLAGGGGSPRKRQVWGLDSASFPSLWAPHCNVLTWHSPPCALASRRHRPGSSSEAGPSFHASVRFSILIIPVHPLGSSPSLLLGAHVPSALRLSSSRAPDYQSAPVTLLIKSNGTLRDVACLHPAPHPLSSAQRRTVHRTGGRRCWLNERTSEWVNQKTSLRQAMFPPSIFLLPLSSLKLWPLLLTLIWCLWHWFLTTALLEPFKFLDLGCILGIIPVALPS